MGVLTYGVWGSLHMGYGGPLIWGMGVLTYGVWGSSLTHSLTHLLLEKPTGFQLVKEFPAFYGNRRFIIAFTSAATRPYPELCVNIS
jgi:hypothetical protein